MRPIKKSVIAFCGSVILSPGNSAVASFAMYLSGQERRWTLLLLISVDVFTMVSTETNETDSNGRQTRRDVSADLMDAVFVLLGSKTVIECLKATDDTGLDEPQYTWTDPRSMVTNDGRYSVTSTGDLVISDVQPRDSGQYDCATTGITASTVHHNVIVYMLPVYSLQLQLTYNVARCTDSGIGRDKIDELNGRLCVAAPCLFDVKAVCRLRRSRSAKGRSVTQPQLVVIIVHSQHPDYQAPNCDPQCIKDDTLAHLEKGYKKVLHLAHVEKKVNSGIEERIRRRTMMKCSSGYILYNNSTCLPCSPGTYSSGWDNTCMSCELGTYQSAYAMKACVSCPDKMTTRGTKSANESACITAIDRVIISPLSALFNDISHTTWKAALFLMCIMGVIMSITVVVCVVKMYRRRPATKYPHKDSSGGWSSDTGSQSYTSRDTRSSYKSRDRTMGTRRHGGEVLGPGGFDSLPSLLAPKSRRGPSKQRSFQGTVSANPSRYNRHMTRNNVHGTTSVNQRRSDRQMSQNNATKISSVDLIRTVRGTHGVSHDKSRNNRHAGRRQAQLPTEGMFRKISRIITAFIPRRKDQEKKKDDCRYKRVIDDQSDVTFASSGTIEPEVELPVYKKPRRCDNYAHMDKHLVGRRNRADRRDSASVPPPGRYGSITDPHKSATYTESAPAIFSSAAWYPGGDAQQMNVPGKPVACMTSAHHDDVNRDSQYIPQPPGDITPCYQQPWQTGRLPESCIDTYVRSAIVGDGAITNQMQINNTTGSSRHAPHKFMPVNTKASHNWVKNTGNSTNEPLNIPAPHDYFDNQDTIRPYEGRIVSETPHGVPDFTRNDIRVENAWPTDTRKVNTSQLVTDRHALADDNHGELIPTGTSTTYSQHTEWGPGLPGRSTTTAADKRNVRSPEVAVPLICGPIGEFQSLCRPPTPFRDNERVLTREQRGQFTKPVGHEIVRQSTSQLVPPIPDCTCRVVRVTSSDTRPLLPSHRQQYQHKQQLHDQQPQHRLPQDTTTQQYQAQQPHQQNMEGPRHRWALPQRQQLQQELIQKIQQRRQHQLLQEHQQQPPKPQPQHPPVQLLQEPERGRECTCIE